MLVLVHKITNLKFINFYFVFLNKGTNDVLYGHGNEMWNDQIKISS